MADKKYIGKTVQLPNAVAAAVEAYRARLEKQLGFPVSASAAIAHAIKRANEK
jgi:hypothetical protein